MSNFYKSKHKGRLIDKAVTFVLDTLPALLSAKVDKENGKGLTSNNFTDADKNKLEKLENYDDTDLQETVAELNSNKEDKSNKVNVIEEASDTEYPTTNAVCTHVGNVVGSATAMIFPEVINNANKISKVQDDLSDYKELNEQNLNTLKNDLDEVNSTANYAYTIASGKNNANVYNNYTEFVDWVDSCYDFVDLFDPIKTGRNTLEIGKNIYVVTLDIPDGWIMEAPENAVPFCENIKADAAAAGRTLDEHIKYLFNTQGYFATKWVKVAALETQKVDLSEYVKESELNSKINTAVSNFKLE